MRIACLQFAPQVGDVDNNLSRADAILERADPKNLDLLVLPELAFSGYNFKSLNHISPFLEQSGKGISSLWARTTALKHDCFVTVGYPETVDITDKWPADPEYYNAAITFSPEGEQVANYRKHFLYYTDETWALEGPEGFYGDVVPGLGNVAMGICMDLKFQAPWHAWEFANHILHKEANLVILSMAWLTGVDGNSSSHNEDSEEPDMETLAYWLSRLEPLIRSEQEGEIIVIFANRCGREDEAVYAGTSAVLGIDGGEVKVYGILGSGESELLVIDTADAPKAKLITEPSPIPADFGKQNWDASSSATPTPEEVEYPASIAEVLSAAKPISPVEPRFPHAYYALEPPKPKEVLPKLNSSAHPNDELLRAVSGIPSNASQSKRSSVQSSIASSVPSSIPPSIHSSMPSSDRSSTHSTLPIIKRPESRKSGTSSRTGTPQKAEPAPDVTTVNGVHNSLAMKIATAGLTTSTEDGAEPTSASSMTTNTPWDKDTNPFRSEEKSRSSRTASPALRNSSPFIAALQQSTNASAATTKPQQQQQQQRTHTLTPKSPPPPQPKIPPVPEHPEPTAVTPLGFYTKQPPTAAAAAAVAVGPVGPIIITLEDKTPLSSSSPRGGPSRHPTADPAFRKAPVRGLFPPDDRAAGGGGSDALRPRSTGW